MTSLAERHAAVTDWIRSCSLKELAAALSEGRVSVRRVARELDLTIDDLKDRFVENDIEPPFDL